MSGLFDFVCLGSYFFLEHRISFVCFCGWLFFFFVPAAAAFFSGYDV